MKKYSTKLMKTNLAAISTIAILATTVTTTGCATEQTNKTNIGSYLNEGGPDRQAAQEGIVMLKNDEIGASHNMLPLTRDDRKVNVFGTTQIKYFYGGSGSGEITMPFYRDNLLQGLRKNPNIQVNETLAQAYEQYASTSTTSHANQEYDPTANITQAKSFSDVAIVVIGRLYGEGGDASNTNGSFQLSTNASGKYGQIGEIELLKLVCTNFNKVIVLLNTTNVLDMD
jgi:beta-glucosidase